MRREHFVVLLSLLAAQHSGLHPTTSVIHGTPSGAPREIVVELTGVPDALLSTLTPTLTVRVQRGVDDEVPVALGVRVSLSPLVLPQFVHDTSVAAAESADIQLMTLLPSGATVYFRGYARTAQGTVVFSPPTEARLAPVWLALEAPGAPSGSVIDDPSPTFVWSSGRVSAPPGPWSYEFRLTRTAGGPPVVLTTTADTTITLPFALQFNTSYRWMVTAQLVARPNVRTVRSASFVIIDPTMPRATLLHQIFPSPFPGPQRNVACIWFDLAERVVVTIDVLDLRTTQVKRVYPPRGTPPAPLDPGRYGREVATGSGCTNEYTWDGTDERGRRVSPGVYLIRMRAGSREFTRRVSFLG